MDIHLLADEGKLGRSEDDIADSVEAILEAGEIPQSWKRKRRWLEHEASTTQRAKAEEWLDDPKSSIPSHPNLPEPSGETRDGSIVSVLARTFGSEASAKGVLESAGIPLTRIPSFQSMTSAQFWASVLRLIDNGIVADRSTLMRAASRAYPGEPSFRPAPTSVVNVTAGDRGIAVGGSVTGATVNTKSGDGSAALAIWRQKLEFLRHERVLAPDPSIRFKLDADIAEAKAAIYDLEGSR